MVLARIRFSLFYAVYVIAAVALLVFVFFWVPFVRNLSHGSAGRLAPPPGVDGHTMLLLGSLRQERSTSFPAFDREKPLGRVRVCAFGDSFTYADELTDGEEYPAMLAECFREFGRNDVEVLNFGNTWYGFHQTYLLWDRVGRGYHCDYVLLGPEGFQPERSSTFNHSGLTEPYYLHARYVLADDSVELVEVAGEALQERFDAYYSFFPRLRYLLYDRHPPAALHALLPKGRTVANPFYYDKRDAAVEALDIDVELLSKMGESGQKVLLLHWNAELVDRVNALGNDDVVAARLPSVTQFPLRAPRTHYSAFGNHRVARHFCAQLGVETPAPEMLEFRDVAEPSATDAGLPAALSDYERVELRIAGGPIGSFCVASAEPPLRDATATHLRDANVTALVGVEVAGRSAVDAVYVPVPQSLDGSETLLARIETSRGSEDVPLGRLQRIDSRINVSLAATPGFRFLSSRLFLTDRSPVAAHLDDTTNGELIVFVGSTPILRGQVDKLPIALTPLHGELEILCSGAGQYTDVSALGDTGTVTLALSDGSASTIEAPLVRWQKTSDEPLSVMRRLPPGPLDEKQ